MNLSRLSGLPADTAASCCRCRLLAAVSGLQGTYLPSQIWLAPVPLGPAVGNACAFN